jgi:hypothetical protein
VNDETIKITTACLCDGPGFCPRYRCRMPLQCWEICQGTSDLGPEMEQQYKSTWYVSPPTPRIETPKDVDYLP